ncbi:MAG: cob(I)yrinic acid a,c-diamide adenosyltransferase [bacterium]
MGLERGTVQVYTGNGKGKTTAAIGQAIRACGHGLKVVMIQFMKGSKSYGEVMIAPRIPNFEVFQFGSPAFVERGNPSEEDLRLARMGMDFARKVIAEGKYDIVILDEINCAIDYSLVNSSEVLELVMGKPERMELILTGRYAPEEVLEIADLVTEMREVKHHYQAGIGVREGIEF